MSTMATSVYSNFLPDTLTGRIVLLAQCLISESLLIRVQYG